MDNSASKPEAAITAAPITEPAPASMLPELHGVTPSDSIIEPRVLRLLRPRRSLGRRVTERLILGAAALLLYAALTLIPFEMPGSTVVLRGTIDPSEQIPSAETTAAIAAPASTPAAPSWLSPNLLYVAPWPPQSPVLPKAEVPLPLERPTRQ
jgi:hypothetical protein